MVFNDCTPSSRFAIAILAFSRVSLALETVRSIGSSLNTILANSSTQNLPRELNKGVRSLNNILASAPTQSLPEELVSTLNELRSVLDGLSQDSELYSEINASLASLERTLEKLNQLARKLSDRPNAVLFAPAPRADPTPEARQ